ncbi:MAG: phage holin family protein [Ruminococcus sp.]|nr:phage holin family protein [Ruminococcus sp.]
MQYMIMILIVLGLAIADFATGYIKAYCTNTVNSQKMRHGGMNKLGELIVMLTACGLDIGIHALGQYYQAAELAEIAGVVTAFAVFAYIVLMELVSILENYAAVNPDAQWAARMIKRLKSANEDEEENI